MRDTRMPSLSGIDGILCGNAGKILVDGKQTRAGPVPAKPQVPESENRERGPSALSRVMRRYGVALGVVLIALASDMPRTGYDRQHRPPMTGTRPVPTVSVVVPSRGASEFKLTLPG